MNLEVLDDVEYNKKQCKKLMPQLAKELKAQYPTIKNNEAAEKINDKLVSMGYSRTGVYPAMQTIRKRRNFQRKTG